MPPQLGIDVMTFKLKALAAGLALIAAHAPAFAGGEYVYEYGGSVKDTGPAGIPVPAPMPHPVYEADYYLRVDIGVAAGGAMSASESGLVYGQDGGGNNVNMPGSWMDDGGVLPMTYGIGVGRYFSDRFRGDITIDWGRQQDAEANGSLTYTNLAGDDIRVTTTDKTTLERGIFLANLYYDFAPKARFNPYIGAGVGFGVNMLDREHRTVEETCTACGGLPGAITTANYTADAKSTQVAFAATAMAGVTYDLGHSMLLDVNYRYLHVGGGDVGINVFNSNSSLKLDSTNEHQLRAGLRLNID